ncbi:unnamed protein product [Angiostrongylus costaricensis]|uniref:Insulin-degrading enzyme n=1 Tax=Angiostrongylus costaricensis TaxID=334426 RepID=A0A158PJJ6_ANGCS|nr:unnamed protein product [Angiostrongylus costaricensis]
MTKIASQMNAKNIVLRRHNDIVKSPEDQREFRGLELTNGLKVFLVSDRTTDKSAAAIDVNAGHLMDPWELPGTAHFCEHMLFLGTDKYPSENEYSKFISAHGGSTNAYTAADHTNYHFDVKPDQLQGALDRFVQFFLAPQFTESATEREVTAHSNNLKNDGWRRLQVERFLSKPGHDYGKFGTGNKKTLMEDAREKGIEPREALLTFHKKWYSSNIMSLCIVGSESLDELESYLGTLGFDTIENKNITPKEWLDSPYGKEQLGKRIEIVPVKDSRSLMVRFPIPDLQAEYKSNPAHYISHLLGHEGKGSLLSELKRLGWVSSLTAGETNLAKGISTFDIHVDLSPDGIDHTEDIVALVFSYIGLIKRTGAMAWIQEELKELGELRFRFKVADLLSYFVMMKRFKSAQEIFNPALHIPEKNEYIPCKLELKQREVIKSDHPRVIYDDEWCRIWFKQDDEYKLPKMVTHVSRNISFYNAELAGLKCHLELGTYGANIKVSREQRPQEAFVYLRVISSILKFSDPLRFEVLFDTIKRALENFAHSQPYTLSQHYIQMLLSDKFWSKEQLLAVCIDVHEVEMFGKEILRAFHIELFVHGNATEQSTLLRMVCTFFFFKLPLFLEAIYEGLTKENDLVKFITGDSYVYRHFQDTHEVSCVEVLYQAGVQTTRENALVELLVQLLREPAFNQLRTVEQLGYIVWTGPRLTSGTLALQLIVQGPTCPDHILNRMEAFLEKIRDDIVSMSDEEFEQQKTGLITRLLEKPKTLGARSRRFWNEIQCRQYDFDRIEVLHAVGKEELLEYFDLKFSPTAPERRKVSF